MDNKVKMFLIKTISQINDDSSKVVKLLGEENFIKRNRKQQELIQEKLYDDMPKEIINHIETFLYTCNKCNIKSSYWFKCDMCCKCFCQKCNYYEVLQNPEEEIYWCLDCMITNHYNCQVIIETADFKNLGKFINIHNICQYYIKLDNVIYQWGLVQNGTIIKTIEDKRNKDKLIKLITNNLNNIIN